MTARFLKPARDELNEAVEFYDSSCAGLGGKFAREVKRCIEVICEKPTTWPVIHHSVRRFLIEGFPYGIIYAIEGEEVIVVAVAHCRRKPKYWLGRVPR